MGDEVLYEGRTKHSRWLGRYTRWVLVSLAAITLVILLMQIDFFKSWTWLWFLSLAGVPGMALVWLRYLTTRFKVTQRRVEFERGIINKEVDSLELWRVLDVRYSQSLFDRITNNGRIVLIGTDKSDPEMELYGLPGHRKMFEMLRDAVQAARHTSRPMELVGQDGHMEEMGGAWHG